MAEILKSREPPASEEERFEIVSNSSLSKIGLKAQFLPPAELPHSINRTACKGQRAASGRYRVQAYLRNVTTTAGARKVWQCGLVGAGRAFNAWRAARAG